MGVPIPTHPPSLMASRSIPIIPLGLRTPPSIPSLMGGGAMGMAEEGGMGGGALVGDGGQRGSEGMMGGRRRDGVEG